MKRPHLCGAELPELLVEAPAVEFEELAEVEVDPLPPAADPLPPLP